MQPEPAEGRYSCLSTRDYLVSHSETASEEFADCDSGKEEEGEHETEFTFETLEITGYRLNN